MRSAVLVIAVLVLCLPACFVLDRADGLVPGEVSGRGIDDDAVGVVPLSVSLAGQSRTVRGAVDGTFRLGDLDAGGYAMLLESDVDSDGVTDRGALVSFLMPLDPRTNEPVGVSLGDVLLPATGRVVGRVVDDAGVAVAGARVAGWRTVTLSDDGVSTFDLDLAAEGIATTDAAGAFVIDHLIAGDVAVAAFVFDESDRAVRGSIPVIATVRPADDTDVGALTLRELSGTRRADVKLAVDLGGQPVEVRVVAAGTSPLSVTPQTLPATNTIALDVEFGVWDIYVADGPRRGVLRGQVAPPVGADVVTWGVLELVNDGSGEGGGEVDCAPDELLCPTNVTVTAEADADSVDGRCSLREALLAAAARCGDADVAPTIAFGDTISTVAIDRDLVVGRGVTIEGGDRILLLASVPVALGIDSPASVVVRGLHLGDVSLRVISDASVEGCIIEGGEADRGGGIFVGASGSLRLSSSIVRDNLAGVDGGGVFLEAGGSLQVSASVIRNNRAVRGGGLAVTIEGPAVVDLHNTIVIGNSATGDGGGVAVLSPTVPAAHGPWRNLLIMQNEAGGTAGRGGGVFVEDGVTVLLSAATIAHNRGGRGGGVSGPAVLSSSIVSGNRAGAIGSSDCDNGSPLSTDVAMGLAGDCLATITAAAAGVQTLAPTTSPDGTVAELFALINAPEARTRFTGVCGTEGADFQDLVGGPRQQSNTACVPGALGFGGGTFDDYLVTDGGGGTGCSLAEALVAAAGGADPDGCATSVVGGVPRIRFQAGLDAVTIGAAELSVPAREAGRPALLIDGDEVVGNNFTRVRVVTITGTNARFITGSASLTLHHLALVGTSVDVDSGSLHLDEVSIRGVENAVVVGVDATATITGSTFSEITGTAITLGARAIALVSRSTFFDNATDILGTQTSSSSLFHVTSTTSDGPASTFITDGRGSFVPEVRGSIIGACAQPPVLRESLVLGDGCGVPAVVDAVGLGSTLANIGGPTETVQLDSDGSAVGLTSCPGEVDQRGRVIAAGPCAAGAIEPATTTTCGDGIVDSAPQPVLVAVTSNTLSGSEIIAMAVGRIHPDEAHDAVVTLNDDAMRDQHTVFWSTFVAGSGGAFGVDASASAIAVGDFGGDPAFEDIAVAINATREILFVIDPGVDKLIDLTPVPTALAADERMIDLVRMPNALRAGPDDLGVLTTNDAGLSQLRVLPNVGGVLQTELGPFAVGNADRIGVGDFDRNGVAELTTFGSLGSVLVLVDDGNVAINESTAFGGQVALTDAVTLRGIDGGSYVAHPVIDTNNLQMAERTGPGQYAFLGAVVTGLGADRMLATDLDGDGSDELIASNATTLMLLDEGPAPRQWRVLTTLSAPVATTSRMVAGRVPTGGLVAASEPGVPGFFVNSGGGRVTVMRASPNLSETCDRGNPFGPPCDSLCQTVP